MKRILFLFFICTSLYAVEPVYCPEQLECTVSGCASPDELWVTVTRANEVILPGVYNVSYVSAPYDADGGYAICVYTHTDVYQTRMLRAAPGMPIVVMIEPQSQWRHEESWGECRPEPLTACPMRLSP